MASVKDAIDFVLRQEDSTLSGKVTTLAGDSGGATRFGLASRSHPELVQSGYFSPKVGTAMALLVAEQVYATGYAAPLHIAEIKDQRLATAVLSMGINAGIGTSARLLQESCNIYKAGIKVDNEIETTSIASINRINPTQLLAEFSGACRSFYFALAAEHENDRPFLGGWLNRVSAWSTIKAA
jgi:lysozyme family protein